LIDRLLHGFAQTAHAKRVRRFYFRLASATYFTSALQQLEQDHLGRDDDRARLPHPADAKLMILSRAR
jgi:hypothetical protein